MSPGWESVQGECFVARAEVSGAVLQEGLGLCLECQAAAFICCPQNTNLSCSQPMFPSEQRFLTLQSIFYPRYFYPLCVVFLIPQEFFSLRFLRVYLCRARSWSGCQTVMSAIKPGMRRIHFSLLESHERVPQQLRICEAALKCSQTNPERRAGILHRYL